MGQLPSSIERTIERVVKDHERPGSTTREAITSLALEAIERNGQIPHAAMRCALRSLVFGRVKSITRRGLPENVASGLSRNVPEHLRAVVEALPRFIAVGEGRKAPIVPALHATAEEWAASAVLKEKKIRQTARTRDRDRDVSRMLETLGTKSLAELLRTEAPV